MKTLTLIVLGISVGAIGFWLLSRGSANSDFTIANVRDENSKQKLPALAKPRVVIEKSKRRLELFDGAKLIKTYKIALGFSPVGDKEQQGDGRTPEGEFYVAVKNPKSKFYLSLGLSYPSIDDAQRGLQAKMISQAQHDVIVAAIEEQKLPPQKTKLGGEIYLHGGGRENDWTWGCVALENSEIKELFEALPLLTPVVIKP